MGEGAFDAEATLGELDGVPAPAAVGRVVAAAAPDPAEGVKRVGELALAAYWKRKDLPRAVALLADGITAGRGAAEAARVDGDDGGAATVLGNVKALSFNLASFTWPGWDEPGIAITPADLAAGRDAAALNLRLALELHRPPEKIAVAHWLVGAHALAAKDYAAALGSFAAYRATATTVEHRTAADGYAALTNLAAARDFRRARDRFDAVVARLRSMNTQDATPFADQLVTARWVFVK